MGDCPSKQLDRDHHFGTVKKSMAMDVPDVSVSVLFDWTQPRCTRCVVNRVRVN